MRALCLALTIPVLSLGLAACGGGNSDEDQITDVIRQAATTTSAQNCTKLETQQFVEQTNFETGAAAIKACKESDPSSNAKTVKVSEVKVNGDKATASVALTGSVFDGQTLEISLVKDGDQWKLDQITDIPKFDQSAFADAFEQALLAPPHPAPQAAAKCVASGFRNAPAASVKAVILSGQQAALVPVLRKCGLL